MHRARICMQASFRVIPISKHGNHRANTAPSIWGSFLTMSRRRPPIQNFRNGNFLALPGRRPNRFIGSIRRLWEVVALKLISEVQQLRWETIVCMTVDIMQTVEFE
mmetsp:Transcript_3496/g.10075  ORF Transcript_3496/g.10075 Transcript_3496/m.10075 type:complete len:106 (+) Transcript_3496:445-762(+)